MPSSPNLSDEDETQGERPTGFPTARLKYSQTIMGGRTGGAGMRVHGKRASTSKRMSLKQGQFAPVKESALSATMADDTVLTKAATTDGTAEKLEDLAPQLSAKAITEPTPDKPSELNVQIQQPTVPEEAPVQRVVQFIPKFRNNDEMERRRRMRMAARRGLGGPAAPAPPPTLDTSSESEEEPPAESSSSESMSPDSDFDIVVNDADEFDPYVLSLIHQAHV